jgi:ribulose-phosphate 3-epimerase
MTDLPIEVDGGVNAETAATVVEAGAQALVAGSAVYKGDPATEMRRIVDIAQRAAGKV